MKYGIGVSPITGKVYVGKLNKKRTERLDKEDFVAFDDVMSDYLIMKFRETKGDTLKLELSAGATAIIKLVTSGQVVAS